MPGQNNRESRARKFEPREGADPHDGFSQDAAANKPPKDGMGLTAPVDENSAETRQSDAVETNQDTAGRRTTDGGNRNAGRPGG